MVSFVSGICNTFSGISGAFSFAKAAFEPEPIPSEWGSRKVYAILQNICLTISAISAITSIFTAIILSVPFFLLSISILTVGLVGSYNLKKMLFIPLPELSAKAHQLVQAVIADVRYDFPEMNTQRTERLIKHVLNDCFPDRFSQKEKDELKKDLERREPSTITLEEFDEMSNQYNESAAITDAFHYQINLLTQKHKLKKEQAVPEKNEFSQEELKLISDEIKSREKNRDDLVGLLEKGLLNL